MTWDKKINANMNVSEQCINAYSQRNQEQKHYYEFTHIRLLACLQNVNIYQTTIIHNINTYGQDDTRAHTRTHTQVVCTDFFARICRCPRPVKTATIR